MLDHPRALVVEKDDATAAALVQFLRESCGFQVVRAIDGEQAANVLDTERVDAMVTELRTHRIDGMRLLSLAKRRHPEVCVVMISEDPDLALATRAMREGAYDFQKKPLDFEKLRGVLTSGLSHQRLAIHVTDLHSLIDSRFAFENLTGQSREMQAVYERMRQIAPTRATVLITGETGTGKELVAKAIHFGSPRKDEPFVTLNCAALGEGVVESELFGHERGAFTGAHRDRKGRFELADGGTLFLDEVSEISPIIQTKLLRVIQEREFERVGGTKTIRVDVRLLVASNKDLEVLVREGKFREDLYYRLRVATIDVPPLRDRKDDIPILVGTFLRHFCEENAKRVSGVTRGAMERLLTYDWPGNVRELRNLVEGLVIFARDGRSVDVNDLPAPFRERKKAKARIEVHVGMTLAEIERAAIEATLQATVGDKQKTAETLGMGLRTLYRKLKEYRL